jgi:ankyrin repeat protein
MESTKLLLSLGLDVNLTDLSGATPLHVASRDGQAAMVEFLLRNRADARARTKQGWAPMALAASQIRPEQDSDNKKFQAIIRRLERAGIELDIHAAIGCDDVQRVIKILQTHPRVGESRNLAGRPALHSAVRLDRKEIVKLLLDNGSHPDIPSSESGVGHDGETALLQVAFWGRLEIAKLLIERGANVNAKAADGAVPLHEAARMGHVDVARLLLEHGADVNAKDNKGETPMDWVSTFGEWRKMTKLLQDRGGAK